MFFERPESGERAVLVHLELGGGSAQEDPRELEELVLSAGGDPVRNSTMGAVPIWVSMASSRALRTAIES